MTYQQFETATTSGQTVPPTLRNFIHAFRFCLKTWLQTPRRGGL